MSEAEQARADYLAHARHLARQGYAAHRGWSPELVEAHETQARIEIGARLGILDEMFHDGASAASLANKLESVSAFASGVMSQKG